MAEFKSTKSGIDKQRLPLSKSLKEKLDEILNEQPKPMENDFVMAHIPLNINKRCIRKPSVQRNPIQDPKPSQPNIFTSTPCPRNDNELPSSDNLYEISEILNNSSVAALRQPSPPPPPPPLPLPSAVAGPSNNKNHKIKSKKLNKKSFIPVTKTTTKPPEKASSSNYNLRRPHKTQYNAVEEMNTSLLITDEMPKKLCSTITKKNKLISNKQESTCRNSTITKSPKARKNIQSTENNDQNLELNGNVENEPCHENFTEDLTNNSHKNIEKEKNKSGGSRHIKTHSKLQNGEMMTSVQAANAQSLPHNKSSIYYDDSTDGECESLFTIIDKSKSKALSNNDFSDSSNSSSAKEESDETDELKARFSKFQILLQNALDVNEQADETNLFVSERRKVFARCAENLANNPYENTVKLGYKNLNILFGPDQAYKLTFKDKQKSLDICTERLINGNKTSQNNKKLCHRRRKYRNTLLKRKTPPDSDEAESTDSSESCQDVEAKQKSSSTVMQEIVKKTVITSKKNILEENNVYEKNSKQSAKPTIVKSPQASTSQQPASKTANINNKEKTNSTPLINCFDSLEPGNYVDDFNFTESSSDDGGVYIRAPPWRYGTRSEENTENRSSSIKLNFLKNDEKLPTEHLSDNHDLSSDCNNMHILKDSLNVKHFKKDVGKKQTVKMTRNKKGEKSKPLTQPSVLLSSDRSTSINEENVEVHQKINESLLETSSLPASNNNNSLNQHELRRNANQSSTTNLIIEDNININTTPKSTRGVTRSKLELIKEGKDQSPKTNDHHNDEYQSPLPTFSRPLIRKFSKSLKLRNLVVKIPQLSLANHDLENFQSRVQNNIENVANNENQVDVDKFIMPQKPAPKCKKKLLKLDSGSSSIISEGLGIELLPPSSSSSSSSASTSASRRKPFNKGKKSPPKKSNTNPEKNIQIIENIRLVNGQPIQANPKPVTNKEIDKVEKNLVSNVSTVNIAESTGSTRVLRNRSLIKKPKTYLDRIFEANSEIKTNTKKRAVSKNSKPKNQIKKNDKKSTSKKKTTTTCLINRLSNVHQSLAISNDNQQHPSPLNGTQLEANEIIQTDHQINDVNETSPSSEYINYIDNQQITKLKFLFRRPTAADLSQFNNSDTMQCSKHPNSCTSNGFMKVLPGKTKSNCYNSHRMIFSVINGQAQLRYENTTNDLVPGDNFWIHEGFSYYLKNTSETECLILFYTKMDM